MSIGALIEKFRAVGLDRIETMNLAMIALEHDHQDAHAPEELLREIHTLKGEAKMMGFADVNLVAHQTEHLLILAQKTGWELPREAIDRIFEGFDLIRTLLTKQAGAGNSPVDLSTYVDGVHRTLTLMETSSITVDDSYTPPAPRSTHKDVDDTQEFHRDQLAQVAKEPASHAPSSPSEASHDVASTPEDLSTSLDDSGDAARIVASPIESGAGKERGTSRSRDGSGNLSSMLRLQSDNSLRVSFSKLERLSDIASEVHLMGRRVAYDLEHLMDLRHELRDWMRQSSDLLPKSHVASLREIGHRLDALSSSLVEENHVVNLRAAQLDEQVRGLRHIPLAQVFSHYPRAVRDLAQAQGKRIHLSLELGHIEVDRGILSALSDPLLHLVRNAVDHGIEPTHERLALSKAEEGDLRLEAEIVGDSLSVTLRDDGRGLDPAHLKRRAVERGVITPDLARELNDQRAMALIFEPGFSTRQEVTDVSGRGIGMDIVLRQITTLGGVVEFESEVGKGTTFTILIPLSSAVIEVLLVKFGEETFAIHAKDIERVVTCSPRELVDVHGAPYYREPHGIIPVCDWNKLLTDTTPQDKPATSSEPITLLVIEKGTTRVAVHIDHVIGEREALNRPLGNFLQGVRLCRGVALTGAGEVIPLLNVVELLNRTTTQQKGRHMATSDATAASTRQTWSTLELTQVPSLQTILVAEDSDVTRTLVSGILRNLGYRVLEAEDGEIAWEMLHAYRVDLVMTDMQMPNLDGLGLIARIREDEDFASLPVIVLSTLGTDRDKERAMNLGADAYLVKLDFREKELVGLVSRYLT